MGRGALTNGSAPVRLAEWALCTTVATALCYTVQGGFNVSEALHGAVPLHVLVCMLLQGWLLAGSVNPQRRVATVAGFAALAAVVCAVAVVASPLDNPIADAPQNLFALAVIYAAVNAAVHALSRVHATCLVLFGLGSFTCGLTQFLYTTNMLVATVVFVLAAAMLIACRSYVDTARGAAGEAAPMFGHASAAGAFLPVLACVLGSVVVLGVIMPLNPPHATIKLFDEYVSYQEERVKTAVEYDEDADKKLTSSAVDETLKPRTTTDRKLAEDAEQRVAPQNAQQNTSKDYLSGEYSDIDLSGLVGNMQALALNSPFPWWIVLLCILAAAVVLLTLPRYIAHMVRLRRITSCEPAEQVRLFYRFFLGRFKKLGLEKPEELSAVEYANLYRARLAPYVGAQEAGSFDHLTALLVNQECAGIEPDEESLGCMRWLYLEFYARCRKKFGLFGYTFRKMTL